MVTEDALIESRIREDQPADQKTADKVDLKVVGKPWRRIDARSQVTGQIRYADDLVMPRMLFMKLKRSPKAHARIVNIDVSKAVALPGVKAVLLGKDMPISFGILPVSQDEHALCPDKVRFIGDPVAAVAALDEETAGEACKLIEVEYQELDLIGDLWDAHKKPEPRIHDYGKGGNFHRIGRFLPQCRM